MNKYFLSCDWGTSSFRLRLIDTVSGGILSELATDQGIAHTFEQWKKAGAGEKSRVDFYTGCIKQHCDKLMKGAGDAPANIPLIISGMASSSIGMLELAYTQMPFAVSGDDLQIKQIEKTSLFPHDIVLISGAATNEDVMRGEETQLVGSAEGTGDAAHLFIFPGTHSKHIIAGGRKALQVETFMTGEFFELLSKKSILANGIEAGGSISNAENKNAFDAGVQRGVAQDLLHSVFLVRTNQLFQKYSKTANYYYLSGLLIGAELGQLQQTAIAGVTIVGDKKLQASYLFALQLLGIDAVARTIDHASATIKGQLAIFKRVYK